MYSAYLPSAKAFWVTMMCGSPPLVSLSNSGIHRPLSVPPTAGIRKDRKSTRLNSSHLVISYAVFCLKKKKIRHALIRHVYHLLVLRTFLTTVEIQTLAWTIHACEKLQAPPRVIHSDLSRSLIASESL